MKTKYPKKAFALMGRVGDILIALPAFKILADQTGEKVTCFTSAEFSGVFDCALSYVRPIIVPDGNIEGEEAAVRFAASMGINAKPLRWWMMGEDYKLDMLDDGNDSVNYKGRNWRVSFLKWGSYQESIWCRTGVDKELLENSVLEIQRDKKRGNELINNVLCNKKKPILLFNFTGVSSPFTHQPEVMRELINWKKDFDLIDLGNIRCERIYDLLGLYDRAALVVTSDTATLHLGRGSNTRMICYVANGWGGSTKPQSCVCKIRYEQAATQQGIKRLNMFINSVLTTK